MENADHYWNEVAGPHWTELQPQIDAQMDAAGCAVLADLAVQPGELALDVGCGCGHTVLQLAGLVGGTGRVLGVDLSKTMLERARNRADHAGYHNVDFLRADAQVHAFAQQSYDLVFSRFGTMFFPEPVEAFRNLRAALRHGGRAGFACWQGPEANEWAEVPLRAVAGVIEVPEVDTDAPGPFSLCKRDKVERVLHAAGFSAVYVKAVDLVLPFGGAQTLEQAVSFAKRVGPAAPLIRNADAALQPDLEECLRVALTPYVGERGVWMAASIFVVTSRRDG